MENNKQTLLKAKGASYKTVDGVTYFKLKSEFDGDYTKNCGLLGEEIDENFYFLRGYDIESVYVDKDRNLVINRVDKDYEPIKVNIGEDLGKDSFKFDKESGTIIVTYPDGTTAKMEGFLVEGKDIRIATDSTIDGDGTIFNPLRISPVDKTGTFAPADEYFDLTNNREMPAGKGKGYRIVTKEKIDNFGCLYPLKAVNMIQKALTEDKSQWRIPTKEDWDELLNAMETNPQARIHDSLSNKWLGEVAGSALKSNNMWKGYETSIKEIPVEGQDVVGLTVYPLGIGPDRNEILNDSNADIEGFTKLSGMWTNTLDKTGNAYVKIFGYNSAQVDQDTYGDGARMSIRLVKDYTYSNYNEIESILGLPYPTQLVYGICDDMPYVKIWTKINVYDSSPALGGIRSSEWDVVTDSDRGVKIVYFINEWDGINWHKKVMTDGDSVVIKNYNEKPYHEWRIIGEELIDTVDSIMKEFEETLNELNSKLDEEIENRENGDKKLLEAIQNEIEIRSSVDKQLHDAISNEATLRSNVDKQLQDAIKNEGVIRKAQDDLLHNAIKQEGDIRKEQDDLLNKAIKEEGDIRKEQDNLLHNAIKEEGEIRKEQDDLLHKAIKEEGDIRKEQDDKLLEVIQKEVEIRESVDSQLKAAIKAEGDIRKNVDDQLLEAIRNEGVIRKNNDITPGEYVLNGANDKEMILPTNGENIDDVKIKLSDDFFNFGPILNE